MKPKLGSLLIASLVLLLPAVHADDQPARYTPEQLKQLRELIARTRETSTQLQTRLDRLQGLLAQLYDDYDFDAEKARRLQAAIVDLQRQLLDNHQRMQTELRSIVGKEQFDVLKQRVKGAVQPTPALKPPPSTSNKQPDRSKR